MLMTMTSTLLGRGMRKDQNLASSSKNCCRSDFFSPLLARLVERSVQTHIFITKAKTTVSSGPWVWLNLTWLPCPLIASQDWTETFDDDQSNHLKTSDRARQNTFKMYIMMHRIWAMHTSNLFLQTNDLLICWRTWDV